jgi:hypothetical protein
MVRTKMDEKLVQKTFKIPLWQWEFLQELGQYASASAVVRTLINEEYRRIEAKKKEDKVSG